MKERFALIFPFAVAVVLPLAGLLLAAAKAAEDERGQAASILAATAVGVAFYVIVFAA